MRNFLFCIFGSYKILFVVSLAFTEPIFAMNNEARDVLIEKFERIYNQLPNEDAAKMSISLRLADLLSEKARFLTFSELEKGCDNCNMGSVERKRAIFLYNEVLPKLETSKRAKVLTQLGHLYEMNGEEEKSEKLYAEIINSEIVKAENGDVLKAEAQLSLAEIYFKRRDFQRALPLYTDVAKTEKSNRQALAAYKIAWSLFNMGEYLAAAKQMELILRTPKLLVKTEQGSALIDEQYKAEVSKDFSTFLAKKGVEAEEINKVYNLSPESVRLANVEYLANELQGLGQIGPAIGAFEFIFNKTKDNKPRAEYALHLAHLYRIKGIFKNSLSFYEKSLTYTKGLTCEADNCNDHLSRLRKYTLDWHNEEKESPSQFLLQAYSLYQQFYPLQVDMIFWKIEALKKSKLPNLNEVVFNELNSLMPIYLTGKEEKGFNNQDGIPTLDELLLMRIEEAEKISTLESKHLAYRDYIQHSRNRDQLLKVEYQLAYSFHADGKFQESSDHFYNLISRNYKSKNNPLITQSAELALSNLAQLKDDKKLTQWATEFAEWIPEKKSEFEEIARKSILNQTENLSIAQKDQNLAWNQLLKMKVEGASLETQTLYYKNKLILAEKLYKFDEARLAVANLLDFKDLNERDRQWALSRKAWLAELALDFKTALQTTKKLELEPYRPTNKDLKLAILAELSGDSYKEHYQKFLKQAETPEQKMAAALKVVSASPNQTEELRKYKKYFESNPDVYTQKLLEILSSARKQKEPFSKQLLAELAADKKMATTPSYILMWRHNFIFEIESLAKKIQDHQIDSKNDRSLNASLTGRVKLLEELEKKLKEAVKFSDGVAQLFVVHHLSKESQRLYEEILSLPTPEGLSEDEQMQYMQLLSQQASPFRLQADDLAKKEKDFWMSEGLVEKFNKMIGVAHESTRSIIMESIALLRDRAPEDLKPSFTSLLVKPIAAENLPTLAELEKAKAIVRDKPLEVSSLESLIEIEKKLKNENMINYLIGRKQQIETLLGGSYE